MNIPATSRWMNAASVSAIGLMIAALPLAAPGQAWAQVAPTGSATQVHTSESGIQVVNIANPNAQGVSVNQYTQFNVAASGLVLNNATAAQGNATGQILTQLAGLVNTNANLTSSAKVILNEVTSTNPTTLAGFIEVAGTRADVIVANPNGITCGGCGVINTAAFTLTTGTPTMSAAGNLTGFNIQSGVITITGAGLNAQTTDYAALLGRKVALSGAVFANVLDVVAGANAWDYTAHSATAIAGTGAAPDYAIDSSVLGGMYANAIRLIATEQGVGVRLLGDVGASGTDLAITAAGDLVLKSSLSAQRDLSITTTATDATALAETDASLSAGRNLTVTVGGTAALTGGAIVANGNLSLTAAALSDQADSNTLSNDNQRFAGGTLALDIGGATTIGGTSYGATGNLTGQFGSLSLTGSGYVYSDKGTLALGTSTGDLALGVYTISSAGNLSLTATQGGIATSAGNGEAVVSSTGLVSLTASGGLTNAGTIAANGGGVAMALGGTSTNSGTITGTGAITLTDAAGAGSESFVNAATGNLIAGGGLMLTAAGLANNGGTIQAATGTTATLGSLTNSGLLITSTGSGAADVLTIGTVANSGTLQSAGGLTLHNATSLTNSGTVLAVGALTIDGGGALTNQSGGALSGATLAATVTSLANAGTLVTSGNLTVSDAGDLTNTGAIGAGGTLALTAQTLENQTPAGAGSAATIQSASGGTITVAKALTNAATLYLATGSGAGTINAGSIANQAGGLITSAGDLALNLNGASLDNAADVVAAGNLAITGSGSALAITNDAGAYLQAGSAATLSIGGTAVNLTNAANGVLTAGTLNLTLAGLTNAGALSAGSGLGYTISGGATNSGTIVAGGLVQGTSASLANQAGGVIQGSGGVQLGTSGLLDNAGTILTPAGSGSAITLTAGTLANDAGAYVQSDQALTLSLSGATLTNAGTLDSSANLAIHGTGAALAITNAATGIIAAQAPAPAAGSTPAPSTVTLTIDGPTSLTNQQGGTIAADHLALNLAALENDGSLGASVGNSSIAVSGALTNTGTLVMTADAAGTGTVTAGSVINSGTLASNNALTLNLSSALTNSGTVQAVGALDLEFGSNAATIRNLGSTSALQAGGLLTINGANTGFAVQAGTVSGGTITATLASLANSGSLVSGGNLTLVASGDVANSGTLGANATLSLTAGTLENGTSPQLVPGAVIQSNAGGTITVGGALTNAGSIYLANTSGDGTITAGAIVNQGTGPQGYTGTIASQGNLAVNLTGPGLTNQGVLFAAGNLDFGANGALTITNAATGTIETGAAASSGSGQIGFAGGAITLINQAGAAGSGLIIGNAFNWSLAGLTNQGTIESRGNFALTLTGAAENAGVLYAQGGSFTLGSASFANDAGATVQGDAGATFNLTGDFSNAGNVIGSTDGKGNLAIDAANFASSGGTIQSSNGLTIALTGSTLTNAGNLIADGALAIHDPSSALAVTNSGIIAAQAPAGATTSASLTIDGQAASLTNQAGGQITADTLALTLNGSGGLSNAGLLVAGNGSSAVSTTAAFVNSGTFYTTGSASITAATVSNTPGGVFEPANLTLNVGNSVSNTGFIDVAGAMTINICCSSTAITVDNARVSPLNANDGLWQVGGTLYLNGYINQQFNLTNEAGGTLLAGSINALYLNNFTNYGTVQAGLSSDFSDFFGTFANTGTVLFTQDGSGRTPQLYGNAIVNSGSLESQGGLTLSAFTTINNQAGGTIAANSGISLYQSDTNPGDSITNAGLLSSPGGISVVQGNAVLITSTGKVAAGTFDYMNGNGTLELQAGANITTGSLYLTVGNLLMDAVPSGSSLQGPQILVTGTNATTIEVANGMVNNGVISTAGDLTLSMYQPYSILGGDFVNAAGAGVASGGNLTIQSPGNIINSGELYGAASVTAVTNGVGSGTIANLANTCGYAAGAVTCTASSSSANQGSIDSGGAITLTSYNVDNYSTINAANAVTVNTTNFVNSVAGNWAHPTSSTTTVGSGSYRTLDPVTPTNCGAVSNGYETCYTPAQYSQTTTTTVNSAFANGLTQASYVPQIATQSASGGITLNIQGTGQNIGATLSGATVTLNAPSGAFSEDTLGLTQTVTAVQTVKNAQLVTQFQVSNGLYSPQPGAFYVITGPAACGQSGANVSCSGGVTTTVSYTTLNPGQPANGIYAGTLTGQVGNLTVSGAPNSTSFSAPTTPTGATGAQVGSGTAMVSGTSASVAASTAPTVGGTSGTAVGSGTTLGSSGVGMVAANGATVGQQSAASAAGPTNVNAGLVTTTVNGKTSVSINGATVNLPTNPNGLFVLTPSPSAQYLIQTNPLYTTPLTDLSSNLLDQLLGLDPDTLGKRLGDGNYEAYLIDQQLQDETGRQLLASYSNLNSELTALYTNAAGDAKSDGLVYGQALTPQQIAALPNDIIWMVSTVVDGQKVLAPVVYLSPATKSALVTGSGIIADNINLQVGTLTNSGGSIIGTQTNSIVASGNVVNTGGGTIGGNQVYLQSTQGTVSNLNSQIAGIQSAAVLSNGDLTNTGGSITAQNVGLKSTTGSVDLTQGKISGSNSLAVSQYKDITITGQANPNLTTKNLTLDSTGGSINVVSQPGGPTATVSAAQTVTLDAAKNITITAGKVSAGQGVALVAGGDINLNTTTQTTTTAAKIKGGTTSTTATTNTGSSVASGGTLYVQSGGNTNITGSSVTAAGDAAIITGGQLNIQAAQNTSTTTTTTKHNGVFQSSSKTVTTNTTTDDSSSLNVGGSAYLKTNGDINVSGGSQVNVGQNLVTDTNGHNVNVTAGNNVTTTDTKTTKSGLGVGGGLYGKTTKTSTDVATTNDASGITAGGQIALTNNNNVTIQGSNVAAGKGAEIDATNGVNILAGQNTNTYTSHTVTECVLCTTSSSSGTASASASAGASASASADSKGVDASASANAGAKASASGQNQDSLAFYSRTVTDTNSASSTSVGSNVSSGGNLVINGGNQVTVQGSNVTTGAGGDLTINTTNLNLLAAQNTSTSSTKTTNTSVGIFVNNQGSANAQANASAGADAKAGLKGVGADASAQASASAGASGSSTVTLGVQHSTATSNDASVTNTGSTLSAGGNLVLNAKDTLTTQGANLNATTGQVVENATNINNLAVQNTNVSSSSNSQTLAGVFVGVNGSANASASVSADAKAGLSKPKVSGDATANGSVTLGASAGVQVNNTQSSQSNASSTAVVTTITAGGGIVRNATNITDQGTQLATGGNITQNATTLTDLAAVNTSSQQSSSSQTQAAIGVFASGTAGAGTGGKTSGVSAGIQESVNSSAQNSGASSSTSVATSYVAGGKITSTTTGATTLVGTNFNGQNGVNISGGTVNYQAATNTQTTTGGTKGGNEGVSVDVVGKNVGVNGGYNQTNTNSSSTTAVAGTITSGNGAVNIVSTQGNTTLVGTQVSGAQGVSVAANGGSVNLVAAQSTSTDSKSGAGFNVDATVGKKEHSGSVDVNYDKDSTTTTTGQSVSLSSSGGAVNVAGNGVALQGAQLNGATGTSVSAGSGGIQNSAIVNTVTTSSVGIDATLGTDKKSVKGSLPSTQTTTTTVQTSIGGGAVVAGLAPNTPTTSGSTASAPTVITSGALPPSVTPTTVGVPNPGAATVFAPIAAPTSAQGVQSVQTGGANAISVAPVTIARGVAPVSGQPAAAVSTAPVGGVAPVSGVPVQGGVTLAAGTPAAVAGVAAVVPQANSVAAAKPTTVSAPIALNQPVPKPGATVTAPPVIAQHDVAITPVQPKAANGGSTTIGGNSGGGSSTTTTTGGNSGGGSTTTTTTGGTTGGGSTTTTTTGGTTGGGSTTTTTTGCTTGGGSIKKTTTGGNSGGGSSTTTTTGGNSGGGSTTTTTIGGNSGGGSGTTTATGGNTGGSTTTAVTQTRHHSVQVTYNTHDHIVIPVIPDSGHGRLVAATLPKDAKVPCWITVDPRTGAIGGNPPKQAIVANQPVVVVETVTLADGTKQDVTITIKPSQFPEGGSQCGTVRTIPQGSGDHASPGN